MSGRTFKQVWAEKEAAGFQYGKAALEQVRFGWELAQQERDAALEAEVEISTSRRSHIRTAERELRELKKEREIEQRKLVSLLATLRATLSDGRSVEKQVLCLIDGTPERQELLEIRAGRRARRSGG